MKAILLATLLALAAASEIESQVSLAVTIYNDDFAMVKDVRNIQFDQGQSLLYFTDVSSNIQTETVTFKAVENPEGVRVYEQNFEKNLVNTEAILQKYINRNVKLVGEFGSEVKTIQGILLSHGYEGYIVQTQQGIIAVSTIVAVELDSLPDGFFTVPTLNWKVWSQTAQTTPCEVAYRTTGFSWKSDYSLTLNNDETKGDIGGWVTIDNNSGKKYENTKLKLIAGEVNIIQQTQQYDIPVGVYFSQAASFADDAPSFEQKSFADYHLYTLSDPVTINDNSQKQVEFIPKAYGISLRKFNEITINTGGYSSTGLDAASKVQFENKDENGLGIPFPKGIFRVFKEDEADGSLQFIGEDSIDHTPKDENITLYIGNAFDITANLYSERRESFEGGGYSAAMNLTITNHKEIASEVEIRLNSYSADNLLITWNDANSAPLEKVTSTRYRIIQVIEADQTVVFKWEEDRR